MLPTYKINVSDPSGTLYYHSIEYQETLNHKRSTAHENNLIKSSSLTATIKIQNHIIKAAIKQETAKTIADHKKDKNY